MYLSYLVQEENGRKLKTKCIAVKEKELVKGPWEKFVVESQASLLHAMPLPLGGVVVIGSETISYYNKQVLWRGRGRREGGRGWGGRGEGGRGEGGRKGEGGGREGGRERVREREGGKREVFLTLPV